MRAENHIATSDPAYTLEETLFLKGIEELKKRLGKTFLSHVEVYRWLDAEGRLRKMILPDGFDVIRRSRPLQRLDADELV